MRYRSRACLYCTASFPPWSRRYLVLSPFLASPTISFVIGAPAAFVHPKQHRSHSRNDRNDIEAMWDPTSQTYKDGIVPSHHTAMEIDDLLRANRGKLKIFGYGSLCWNPGADGILSLADIERDELDHDATASDESQQTTAQPTRKESMRKVTTTPGRAVGYQRCWCQRSADHRGTPQFNGIVCTLLSDDEVWKLRHNENTEETSGIRRSMRPSMTEGMIYTVDRDLVEDCLAELDFREKGVSVVDDFLLGVSLLDSIEVLQCHRDIHEMSLAAATMSAAIGPSGPNDIYLHRLHQFLTHAAQHSSAAALALEDHSGDVNTGELATMVNLLQTKYRPYFLLGAGSNEHNQLLLRSGVDGEGRGFPWSKHQEKDGL